MRLEKMIMAVDAHACGEPGRVIVGGVLDVPGDTMFQKKVYLEAHQDELISALTLRHGSQSIKYTVSDLDLDISAQT